jgi:hypothetical protein
MTFSNPSKISNPWNMNYEFCHLIAGVSFLEQIMALKIHQHIYSMISERDGPGE